MLHGSETCPVRKENVVALQRGGVGHQSCSCDLKLCSKLDSRHNTKLLAEIAKTEKKIMEKTATEK